MQKIKLMFEFMHGPIWPSSPFTGQAMTDIKLVDNDPDLTLMGRFVALTRLL
ncbi:hypothetical protein FC52_GL000729 [Lactobacillus pasteurii DSM 23907 = CRBIP 24.76]|uniref:Uncharacterized protein n=1 Tax=Lactobacillus pasteurii DSM 23907 = CRBIP 24.76 TaxID=1423790 RepID=I7LA53_9LACO|nr:hypothetical protein [Lactobacillus pasteurii]KRK07344.1 hypothetical protein FC52_GL000729 [Lactobacillus pasteurii DSM 23907 = CRBIP 24.76]TDG76835.1 hypothetical protein C5L33_001455 [Lactobacillus pasteurii]CCI84416.1 Protein of unknown function [Lactobacillus pasteurii DSM 23907 = CRBIP 24.76]